MASLRAALYTRVSVDRRDTGRSVGEQEADLRQTCAREGWSVERVFTDNDRSASKYA
ncbi:MAG: recombinase family protein, partial [Actinobacteria bacterium]|nr:recombinase family protein [Actinomycetota bacterium]